MTLTYFAGRKVTGTAADRTGGTWTNLPAGWIFTETDTRNMYYWDGSAWQVITGPSATVTETNRTFTSPTLNSPTINTPTIKYTDVTKTNANTPYSIATTDRVIRADASSGALTVTLPTAVGVTGKKYTIKRIDNLASSVLVTVATTSSQTIDGAPNQYLWNAETIEVMSDGANWVVVQRDDPSASPMYYMFKGSRRYCAGNNGMYMTLIASTTSPAIDTLWALPFIVPKTTKFNVITFNVTTLANPSNARAGIYRDTGNSYPGALIFDTTAISCATTGAKDTTITSGLQILPTGLYWLAWECDTASPLQIHCLSGITGSMIGIQGYSSNSTLSRYGYSVAHTFGALPDPYTVGATILTTAPSASNPVPAIMLQPL